MKGERLNKIRQNSSNKKKKIHMKFKLPVILFPISKVQGRNGKKAILLKLCRKR